MAQFRGVFWSNASGAALSVFLAGILIAIMAGRANADANEPLLDTKISPERLGQALVSVARKHDDAAMKITPMICNAEEDVVRCVWMIDTHSVVNTFSETPSALPTRVLVMPRSADSVADYLTVLEYVIEVFDPKLKPEQRQAMIENAMIVAANNNGLSTTRGRTVKLEIVGGAGVLMAVIKHR